MIIIRGMLVSACLLLAAVAVAANPLLPITTAQQDAETMARTGLLKHCGRNAIGSLEGIGAGATREQAIRNCCYFNQRKPMEIGVAYSVRTGKYFAVIRYK